jgi:hypothetical protein
MPTNEEASGDSKAPQEPPPPTPPPSVEGNENGKGGDGEQGRHQIAKDKDGPPHWTRYMEAACAVILVLITGTYTYFARQQAGAAITAAGAAKSAADIADATLKHVTANDKATSEAALNAFKDEQRAYISTTVASPSSSPILIDPQGRKHYCVDAA